MMGIEHDDNPKPKLNLTYRGLDNGSRGLVRFSGSFSYFLPVEGLCVPYDLKMGRLFMAEAFFYGTSFELSQNYNSRKAPAGLELSCYNDKDCIDYNVKGRGLGWVEIPLEDLRARYQEPLEDILFIYSPRILHAADHLKRISLDTKAARARFLSAWKSFPKRIAIEALRQGEYFAGRYWIK